MITTKLGLTNEVSDKVYIVTIDGLEVTYSYGKRGGTLTSMSQTADTKAEARMLHDTVVADKIAKGYSIESGSAKAIRELSPKAESTTGTGRRKMENLTETERAEKLSSAAHKAWATRRAVWAAQAEEAAKAEREAAKLAKAAAVPAKAKRAAKVAVTKEAPAAASKGKGKSCKSGPVVGKGRKVAEPVAVKAGKRVMEGGR